MSGCRRQRRELWRGTAYVIAHAGEESIIVGTDYGHADYSNDMEAIATLAKEGVLAAGVGEKILSDNPRRLYGL